MSSDDLDETIIEKIELFIGMKSSSSSVSSNLEELTTLSQKESFFESAHRILLNSHSFLESNKNDCEALLTKLMKDRVKFEFEDIAAHAKLYTFQQFELAKHFNKGSKATLINISEAISYLYLHQLL